MSLDVPQRGSINLAALVLMLLSVAALFWFKLGMARILARAAGLGIAWRFATG